MLVTAPDAAIAATLGRILVESRTAACANIVPGVRSLYAWQGEICDDAEVLLFIKTRRNLFPAVVSLVRENHPYVTPEIIALPIVSGSQAYLEWIEATTKESANGEDAS